MSAAHFGAPLSDFFPPPFALQLGVCCCILPLMLVVLSLMGSGSPPRSPCMGVASPALLPPGQEDVWGWGCLLLGFGAPPWCELCPTAGICSRFRGRLGITPRMSIVIFGVNFLGYILALVKIWLRAAPSLSCFLLLLPKPSGAVVTSVFGGIPYTFPPEEFQALWFFLLAFPP